MAQLAIKGGDPVRSKDDLFPAYNTIGEEEKAAALRVLDSGVLSGFLGQWKPEFYGGPEVQAFEKAWAEKFGVKHAIAMNSASNALIAAIGAIGIEPGDEVIVTPFSMCISATAPLFYGAVPIFADIEPEYFCLDPRSIEASITLRTKAILVVDIFGGSHDCDAINAIAKKHGLKVIADSAQCPGATYKGKYVGTLSDIGIYSLNVHKNIQTGEGTVVVTNDDDLAQRLQLIRNHAEAVVNGGLHLDDISNLVGYNSRMTEICAAIGHEQLKKIDVLNVTRRKNVAYLSARCQDMLGFRPSPERPDTMSVFHNMGFLYDESVVGVPRDLFVDAIKAELPPTRLREFSGPLIYGKYINIHRYPLFQKKIAFGSKGYPFVSPLYDGTPNYQIGICPVAERLYDTGFIGTEMMRPGMEKKDLDDVLEAFHKVYKGREQLRQ